MARRSPHHPGAGLGAANTWAASLRHHRAPRRTDAQRTRLRVPHPPYSRCRDCVDRARISQASAAVGLRACSHTHRAAVVDQAGAVFGARYRFLRDADIGAGMRVLDVGCGMETLGCALPARRSREPRCFHRFGAAFHSIRRKTGIGRRARQHHVLPRRHAELSRGGGKGSLQSIIELVACGLARKCSRLAAAAARLRPSRPLPRRQQWWGLCSRPILRW
jgi:hypothetical protein